MLQPRLYISADIEGTAGVVSGEHMNPKGFEYQQARQWMTAEVAAASEAAFAAGIEQVVVSDSHGNGQSLLLDQLPDAVQVVRSWPRPLCMMEGIDVGQYCGALLLGYHAGASDLRGVLAHTLHGGGITEVRLNGQVASETVISAATAAHFGVPVILVSGDDAYIEHAEQVLPGTTGVVTKWAHSFTSARMLKPSVAQARIAEGVSAALAGQNSPEALRAAPLSLPIQLEVRCLHRKAAELLAYLPGVHRQDAHTIGTELKDMVATSQFLQFLLASGSLTPA